MPDKFLAALNRVETIMDNPIEYYQSIHDNLLILQEQAANGR